MIGWLVRRPMADEGFSRPTGQAKDVGMQGEREKKKNCHQMTPLSRAARLRVSTLKTQHGTRETKPQCGPVFHPAPGTALTLTDGWLPVFSFLPIGALLAPVDKARTAPKCVDGGPWAARRAARALRAQWSIASPTCDTVGSVPGGRVC